MTWPTRPGSLEVQLDTLTSIKEIEVWLREDATTTRQAKMYVEGRATETFLTVFAALVVRFGEPDFPGDKRWREWLGLSSQLLAVWNFDYHQVSVRLDSMGGEATAVIARHKR